MVCGLANMNGPAPRIDATSPESLPDWIWAETANDRKLNAIQRAHATASRISHLRMCGLETSFGQPRGEGKPRRCASNALRER